MKKLEGKNKEFKLLKKIWIGTILTIFLALSVTFGQVYVPDSPKCMPLMADQTINAGTVCMESMDDMLKVVITTNGDWELTEAHLWVGEFLVDLPQNKKGNPKVGHFPYKSGIINGQQHYQFYVPYVDLGGDEYFRTLCGSTFNIAAHASLQKPDGLGGYYTESGWAQGEPLVTQGSWAMSSDFGFLCAEVPPEAECEKAFAYGDTELKDIQHNGSPITNDWGWQITVNPGDRISRPLYIGATGNNTNNGTVIGELNIGYSGTWILVQYNIFFPYYLSETNLYVGTTNTNTAIPALFGNSHTLPIGERLDAYQLQISGSPIYLVGHAIICRPPQGEPEE